MEPIWKREPPEHKQKGCLCYARNKTSCVANPNQELL